MDESIRRDDEKLISTTLWLGLFFLSYAPAKIHIEYSSLQLSLSFCLSWRHAQDKASVGSSSHLTHLSHGINNGLSFSSNN